MPEPRYLIAGQGIAGTALAWHLHDRGQKFLLVDNPQLPSSSHVAAGIFNPLTGRKLVKTWLADELFPYAVRFYGGLEKKLKKLFLHNTDIYRPYRTPAEKVNYQKWAAESGYQDYLSPYQADLTGNAFINAPYNGLSVSRSGWVDLPHFLDSSRTYFKELGFLSEGHFSSEDLTIETDHVFWKQMRFEKVINCMGVRAATEPLFDWLPFNPVKGELLECRIEGYSMKQIVNQGIFILPVSEDVAKVGATYSWHELDWQSTPDARTFLAGKLSGLAKVPFSIQAQVAGIRPSSQDRRPFAGRHPEHKPVYIFNGLGTKGVTLGPYFARQMADFLLKEEELLPDVNIERYFSLYSKPRLS